MINVLAIDDGSFKPCNFACSYCRKSPSTKLSEGYWDEFRGVTTFSDYRENHIELTSILETHVESFLYKISGHGEITLLPDFHRVIPSTLGTPVVITNGSKLSKNDFNFLSEKNAILTVSLDGNTSFLNKARSGNPKKIMSTLEKASDYDIPIEINSVLTRWNIEKFDIFLQRLQNIDDLVCFPFPVRDFSTKGNTSLKSNNLQMNVFIQNIVKKFGEFENILPPLEYIELMLQTMSKGRQIPCFLPNLIIPLNWEFDVLKCPCGPTESYGNLKNRPSNVLNEWELKSKKFRSTLPFNQCKQCFTHYDVINLYLLESIKETNLSKIPSLSNPKLYGYLNMLVKEIKKENRIWENQYLSQASAE